jgi:hypothetical protein
MRDKNLLQLFLILNVALAGCFVVYLLLSSNGQPKVTAAAFPAAPTKSNTTARPAPALATNPAVIASNAVALVATNAPATNEPVVARPIFTRKKFNWEQVESDEYKTYLDSLRAVGCPEDKVRNIVMADINELFAKRRVTEAKALDPQWWKARPDLMIANALQEKGRALEEQRRSLVEKLLGLEVAENEKSEAMLWSNVQLTGEVLGGLPSDVHNAVQEICGRSIERTQGAFWARINDGQQPNPIDMARLRDQTRVDLRKVLAPDAMEEFLLRYSHNSEQLRTELSGLNPTPDEFRKVFRAIDPLDHQLQLEFGGPESLSQQQRERYERQRDAAIKEAFGTKRYQEYLATKDPAYRQAQLTARQYGAPDKAIQPIYEMTKASEAKRRKILSDAGMTAEQKSAALNAVNIEQIQMVQRIVSEAASRR